MGDDRFVLAGPFERHPGFRFQRGFKFVSALSNFDGLAFASILNRIDKLGSVIDLLASPSVVREDQHCQKQNELLKPKVSRMHMAFSSAHFVSLWR